MGDVSSHIEKEPSRCESFTSEKELVERGRALHLPGYHFISKLIAWWDEKGFWTLQQRRGFVKALLIEEADHKEENIVVVVVKETTMPNLVINLPKSMSNLLQEAIDSRQEFFIKTQEIELRLTQDGWLTSSVKSFHIEEPLKVEEPLEVEEPAEPLPTTMIFSRPKLVKPDEPEEVVKLPLQLVLSAGVRDSLKTIERREALIRLIRERGKEGLKQADIAKALTEQGFSCVGSTVCNDLNLLLEQGKISVFSKRGTGRIYSVNEIDIEACGF